MTTKLWYEPTIDDIVDMMHQKAIVPGLVKGIETLNLPVKEKDPETGEEKVVVAPVECAVIIVYGFRTICRKEEFADHQYRSLVGFVGHQVDVIIESVDVETKSIATSRRKALELLREQNKDKIKEGAIVQGIVNGFNKEKGNIYLLIYGYNAFMRMADWDLDYATSVFDTGAVLGQPVDVVIKNVYETEEGGLIIRVSRKELLEDPWKKAADKYKVGNVYVGQVTGYVPGAGRNNGVFCKLEPGVEIICNIKKSLRAIPPHIGMPVTIMLSQFDTEKRRGRGVVVNYPYGVPKDVRSFI